MPEFAVSVLRWLPSSSYSRTVKWRRSMVCDRWYTYAVSASTKLRRTPPWVIRVAILNRTWSELSADWVTAVGRTPGSVHADAEIAASARRTEGRKDGRTEGPPRPDVGRTGHFPSFRPSVLIPPPLSSDRAGAPRRPPGSRSRRPGPP